MTMVLMLTSSVAAATSCRPHGDSSGDAGLSAPSSRVDLFHVVCDGKRYCDDIDDKHPDRFVAHVATIDCLANDRAVLSGSWWIGDAEARPFEWKAEVRLYGVFPTLAHVGTNLGCTDLHPQIHSPDVIVALDPDGLDWAKLEGDNVFIPFGGKATIDHQFHATATLDGPDATDASPARVTVSIERPLAPPAMHGGLGRDDSFPWGEHVATVVRVVAPQSGELGAIGWVEIKLADAVAPARAP